MQASGFQKEFLTLANLIYELHIYYHITYKLVLNVLKTVFEHNWFPLKYSLYLFYFKHFNTFFYDNGSVDFSRLSKDSEAQKM
jgi:hypothetical protein